MRLTNRSFSGFICMTRTTLMIHLRPLRNGSRRSLTTARLLTRTPASASLLDALRKHGLYDETLIAVMADHGESLGAHGENTHGVFLYDETLHVPLLIKLPLNRAAGRSDRNPRRAGGRCAHDSRRRRRPASCRDAGAILARFIKPPDAKKKTDANTPPEDRPAYAETDYPHRAFGWSALRALRTGKYLYIQAPAIGTLRPDKRSRRSSQSGG